MRSDPDPPQALAIGESTRLGGSEHAIKSSQYHHLLRRAVRITQQIGNLLDQICEIVAVGHSSNRFRIDKQGVTVPTKARPKPLQFSAILNPLRPTPRSVFRAGRVA